jgi:hypothetical protein
MPLLSRLQHHVRLRGLLSEYGGAYQGKKQNGITRYFEYRIADLRSDRPLSGVKIDPELIILHPRNC